MCDDQEAHKADRMADAPRSKTFRPHGVPDRMVRRVRDDHAPNEALHDALRATDNFASTNLMASHAPGEKDHDPRYHVRVTIENGGHGDAGVGPTVLGDLIDRGDVTVTDVFSASTWHANPDDPNDVQGAIDAHADRLVVCVRPVEVRVEPIEVDYDDVPDDVTSGDAVDFDDLLHTAGKVLWKADEVGSGVEVGRALAALFRVHDPEDRDPPTIFKALQDRADVDLGTDDVTPGEPTDDAFEQIWHDAARTLRKAAEEYGVDHESTKATARALSTVAYCFKPDPFEEATDDPDAAPSEAQDALYRFAGVDRDAGELSAIKPTDDGFIFEGPEDERTADIPVVADRTPYVGYCTDCGAKHIVEDDSTSCDCGGSFRPRRDATPVCPECGDDLDLPETPTWFKCYACDTTGDADAAFRAALSITTDAELIEWAHEQSETDAGIVAVNEFVDKYGDDRLTRATQDDVFEYDPSTDTVYPTQGGSGK